MSKIVENYTLLESLGEDCNGFDSFKARHVISQEYFWIWSVSRSLTENSSFFKGHIVNQIQICKKLNHPNLLRFVKQIKSVHNIYSVWEYCSGGTLFEYIQREKLSDAQMSRMMKQLAEGVSELHRSDIIHMNIHPKNIYVGEEATPKIANFAYSKQISKEGCTDYDTNQIRLNDLLAPQMLNKQPATLKSDIYSLGMVFGFIKYQTLVFQQELAESIKQRDTTAQLIQSMLKSNPKQRLDIKSVLLQINRPRTLLLANKSARILSTKQESPLDGSSDHRARPTTPTSSSLTSQRFAGLKNVNKTTHNDSPVPNTSNLRSILNHKRELQKEQREKGQKQGSQAGSTIPVNIQQKAFLLHQRKLMRERIKYTAYLRVSADLLGRDLHKLSTCIAYLMLKKANIIVLQTLQLIENKKDQGERLKQLHKILIKQAEFIQNEFELYKKEIADRDHRNANGVIFSKQLQDDRIVNEAYYKKILKQYIGIILMKVSSSTSRDSPTKKSKSMKQIDNPQTKSILVHLFECYLLLQPQDSINRFFNQTVAKYSQQPYLKQLTQWTNSEIETVLTKTLN